MPSPTLRETVQYTRDTTIRSMTELREGISNRERQNEVDESTIAQLDKLVKECNQFLGVSR